MTFDRKGYSREEINGFIAEQLGLCIEPICKEIGQVVEGLIKRVCDLEVANNAMIEELRSWKAQNIKVYQ